ncbi:SANT/Myb domain [Dillenia turbinata]|uniref:SANT/Myb domain n=1 Tax=Dillenia turbinata TaxID=194707 RepID=A0AAN8VJ46_9MAGN
MVCTANDLLEWKDFPKGLRVLLLNDDSSSAAELRSKLENMDYIVSTFCNKNEALSAISNKPESFHVAIVEVNTSNTDESFKFLETAKHLPTIMTSNIHCLSTIMKCIALGAVEFLRKPLSEDKLRNIWQHVVHKAYIAERSDLSESVKPTKELVVPMLPLQPEKNESGTKLKVETDNVSRICENDHEQSVSSDKYPAPSTPQLKHGGRKLDDGDCNEQTNSTSEKESGEQIGESKSVETTCENRVADTVSLSETQKVGQTAIKEEEYSVEGFKSESNGSLNPENKDARNDLGCDAENLSKGSRANRKKMKVDWTQELHKKFVQAVEQLGLDQAIPSRILEVMKVEGLTRHNVASHLQKYRMQRRHILPKEEERRWPNPRDPNRSPYYPRNPVMAFPSYHSNHAFPSAPIYPVWGRQPAGFPVWGSRSYPMWQQSENWLWKPYPAGIYADAWGCPVMPTTHGAYSSLPQSFSGFPRVDAVDNGNVQPPSSFDLHPAEEVIDEVVREAISKPWLPLPLGLKPPSTESVLAELSRQGISNIPPHINAARFQ